MSKGVESLMRRRERECWEPHEVRRASKGEAASELVLGVLAAKQKMRPPHSKNGCTAQRKCRPFADNGGAMGARVGCLEKRCSRAAAGIVMPVCGPVNGFVEGKDVGGPPKMETWRARALSSPWGATNKGVGHLIK
jgi:hypothetical protein